MIVSLTDWKFGEKLHPLLHYDADQHPIRK
jgi:hypothetical protein